MPPDTPRRERRRHPWQGPSRRSLLGWLFGLLLALLCYPLLRFSGHRRKPKPRLVKVAAPLPLSGIHTERDFILLDLEGKVSAVSRRCTHLGCRVNFHEDVEELICPCHQSRFSPLGQRLAGPAELDLPVFPVTVQRDQQNQVTGYTVEL
ncbi:MAG: hypothetical protein CSA34_05180 [Desulfobulbus propionicus]|nr:MAG: hypothetical protein CSA34_05180 [Desulfobulbus propionicus]